jgi:uncharacterized membrane protein
VSQPRSHWLALAGVAVLAAWLLSPPSITGAIAALPLLAVALASLMRLSHAAIGTAIVMLPYFCYGVMDSLTNPQARGAAFAFTTVTIVVFLAALDVVRRQRVHSARGVEH